MGLLRFLLAFAVFNAHAGLPLGFSMLAGSTAVHCFFVISGYYMAMVLSEKYHASATGYYEFVSNRALRLMPSYLMVAALTLLAGGMVRITSDPVFPFMAAHETLSAQDAPWWLFVASTLGQLTLMGLDALSFVTWSPSAGLEGVTPVPGVEGSLQSLLLVPPAWSLSVEIYFYLLAPFVVRLPLRALAALMVASVVCRLVLAWSLDWRVDPWSYRFAPSELVFFLSGVLAYRLATAARSRAGSWMLMMAGCGAVLGMLEILGLFAPGMGMHKWARVPLFALLCAMIPTLFQTTRRWRWDRYIGELSYPLYISHFLVIWAAGAWITDLQLPAARIALVLTAIGVAVALQHWIDAPIDRYRQRRLARFTRGAVVLPATARTVTLR